jgi:hypothetical protein
MSTTRNTGAIHVLILEHNKSYEIDTINTWRFELLSAKQQTNRGGMNLEECMTRNRSDP